MGTDTFTAEVSAWLKQNGMIDLATKIDESSKPSVSSIVGARGKPRQTQAVCHRCKGLGWVTPDVPVNHPDFGKAVRCRCQEAGDIEKRRKYLMSVDGLTSGERSITFDQFQRTEDNEDGYQAVVEALDRRRGIVTLTGQWGRGKSMLLICAVNWAREHGMLAVYSRVADLLDYLRRAYDPNATVTADARWDLLMRTDVLALDEMDRFNTTQWALEQFFRLVDNRWREMDRRLTLFATNTPVNALPGEIASRLRDGRAAICTLRGPDMRPAAEW